MATEIGFFSRGAAFGLAATGFVALVGAVQVSALVIFRNGLGVVPAIECALAVFCVFLAIKLAHPRAWARVAGAAALVGLAVGGTVWGAWLGWHGVFTGLTVLTPMMATGTLLLVVVSWSDVGSVARVRADAEAETARLLEEARRMAPEDGYVPPAERRWVLPLMYTIVGVPAALFAVALLRPTWWEWMVVRAEGLAAGRSPFAQSWVARATAYPYSGSPLAWYLEYEAKWHPLPTEDILAVADGLADDVAWHLTAATGITDPVAAEAKLWADGREKELPLWVAAGLRARHAFYNPESLFSRSFDPEIHVLPDTIHFDCDQLVYLYLHVAWRLDLAMSAIPSPMHAYLRYAGPDGQDPLYVETTRFATADAPDPSEPFFIDADWYPSGRGGTWASDEVVAAAGYYQPWSERDIRDAIVANVMVGIAKESPDAPVTAELEEHLAGTREVTLVTNLYERHVVAAKKAAAAGDADTARREATRAREIRAEYGALVIFQDAEEERILARLGAAP